MSTLLNETQAAICPLGPDHLFEVIEFREAMITESGFLGNMGPDWKGLTYRHYLEQYEQGLCQHHGAFIEGRLVATSGAVIRSHFPYFTNKIPRGGWIMDVYVQPPFRGRHLASRLTQSTVAWLREQGVQDIRLMASAQAKQLRLYEKLGFVFTNEMRLATT